MSEDFAGHNDRQPDQPGVSDPQAAHSPLPPVEEDPDVGDSRRPLIRAARGGLIALTAVTVFSLALWGATRDLPGIYGALIGAAIGGGFLLMTIGVVLVTANSSPQVTLGAVLGSWLLKAALLLVVLIVIKDKTFYDNTALGVTIILVLVAMLGSEIMAITRTKLMYIPEK